MVTLISCLAFEDQHQIKSVKRGAAMALRCRREEDFFLEKVNGDILNCGLITATEIKCFFKRT